ncbi:hypothetical protein TNCV_5012681 [Trichonephila clavipes]|nr:hypothetical protein TNCV_5012681 [Trichonephila clavipes]
MDFTEINSKGKRGELLGRIDRPNSRFRTAKTTIIKFGLHASFVELESAKRALNETTRMRSKKLLLLCRMSFKARTKRKRSKRNAGLLGDTGHKYLVSLRFRLLFLREEDVLINEKSVVFVLQLLLSLALLSSSNKGIITDSSTPYSLDFFGYETCTYSVGRFRS